MIHSERSIQSYTCKPFFLFALFFIVAVLGFIQPLLVDASPGMVGFWEVLEEPPVCSDTNGMKAPDEYVAVAIDSHGSVIAVSSYGVIAKYNYFGNRQWKKWLNGQTVIIYACDEGEQWLDYSPSDVLVDDNDYIYVLGLKRHAPSDQYVNRIFLMKLTPSGSEVWTKEIATYNNGPNLVGVPPSTRPKMRWWHPDSGGTYLVIGCGIIGNSGFLCYDLSGNLIWHKNDGEPTGPFDLDGQRLFKGHLVMNQIAPAIDVCDTGSFDNSPLSCYTVETTPPPKENNPPFLDNTGDLICSSHTGKAQKVFMVSSMFGDSLSFYYKGFALVTLVSSGGGNGYIASESKYFKRGALLDSPSKRDHGRGLGVTSQGNVWMVGSWWYDPVIVIGGGGGGGSNTFSGASHIYAAKFSPNGGIITQYDYGHGKICDSEAQEVAIGQYGNPVIVGFDQDPATGENFLFISSHLHSLSRYRYIMPTFQLNIFDPVSPTTGNYADKAIDLNYPTGGIPLTVARTYASRFAEDLGRLGYGWHLDILDMHIDGIPGRDDKATMVWGDGHRVEYMVSSVTTQDSSMLFEFTPIGSQDDSITLTAFSSDAESYFKIYIKKIDRTIVFAHSEADDGKWYPTAMFRGHSESAPGAFPLIFNYSSGSITVTDSVSGKNVVFTLAQGRVTQVRGSAGEVISYTYDQNGNLSQVTRADGTVINYAYDSNHHLTSIIQGGKVLLENSYDLKGRVTRQVDEAGHTTTFSYDDTQNKTTVTSPDNAVTTYFYNDEYRLTRVENQYGLAKRYSYDLLGRLTSITMPDGSVTRFRYDESGNLVEKTDPFGNKTLYSYDANGHLVASTDPMANSAGFTYNERGLLTSWTNPKGGAYAITYNSLGQKTSVLDPFSHATTYAYDSSGLISSKAGRDGSTVTYLRDAAGRVMQEIFNNGAETITYTYDSLGRPTSVAGSLGTITYTYNERGYKASEKDAFGHTITYGYTDGHLSSITAGSFNITAQRDSLGRPTLVQDSFGHSLSYGYDTFGRLVSITGPSGVQVLYGYNTTGLVDSITLKDAQNQVIRTMAITRGPEGRVEAVEDRGAPSPSLFPSDLSLSFNQMDRITSATYDLSGRLKAYGGDSYTYDARGRLKSASKDGHSASFSYDPLGRRVEITDDGAKRRIIYAGAAPIMETDGSGEVTSYFIFAPGICLVVEKDGTLKHILLSDFRKNVVCVLDGSGALVSNRLYSPYGAVLAQTGSWPVPFGFLGESGLYTLSSGLVLTRTRAYDPVLARFLTPDPARPNPMQLASLNRYIYSYDDPVNLVDTSGLSPFPSGPFWLIPCVGDVWGCNVRPTLHPTNTLGGVAFPPMNSWSYSIPHISRQLFHVADSSPIYSDRYAMTGGGNTQLAPNFTDSAGLMANFWTLASTSGESEPPPGAPIAVAPGDGYVAGFSTVPIIALI